MPPKKSQKEKEQQKKVEEKKEKEKKNLLDTSDRFSKFRFDENRLADECLNFFLDTAIIEYKLLEKYKDSYDNMRKYNNNMLDVIIRVFSIIRLLFKYYKNELQKNYLNPELLVFCAKFINENDSDFEEIQMEDKFPLDFDEVILNKMNKILLDHNRKFIEDKGKHIQFKRYMSYLLSKLNSIKELTNKKKLLTVLQHDADDFLLTYDYRDVWFNQMKN